MKKPAKFILGIAACLTMLMIILDSRTAVSGISDGVTLCLQSVIPALFPFLVLSGIMSNCFLGQRFPFMEPLRRLCRIPAGTESILFIGFISGYPVGAQLITDAYSSENLSKKNAMRMLGFCSNAGPSFLFGMLSAAFSKPVISWILWIIHIVSAILVGWLIPGGATKKSILVKQSPLSITKTLQNAIKSIATVCGWVILFRLILNFLRKWILYLLPLEFQILISGLIELANGCVLLLDLPAEGIRFIFASAMLAFGGICVAMQTISVTGELGTGYYFPGKLMQTLLSVTISSILQPLFFKGTDLYRIPTHYLILMIISIIIFSYLLRKKVVAFSGRMLYNIGKECT